MRAEEVTTLRTQKIILDLIPLGPLGLPQDHTSTVVLLALDDSEYITGATIDVNRGESMI